MMEFALIVKDFEAIIIRTIMPSIRELGSRWGVKEKNPNNQRLGSNTWPSACKASSYLTSYRFPIKTAAPGINFFLKNCMTESEMALHFFPKEILFYIASNRLNAFYIDILIKTFVKIGILHNHFSFIS